MPVYSHLGDQSISDEDLFFVFLFNTLREMNFLSRLLMLERKQTGKSCDVPLLSLVEQLSWCDAIKNRWKVYKNSRRRVRVSTTLIRCSNRKDAIVVTGHQRQSDRWELADLFVFSFVWNETLSCATEIGHVDEWTSLADNAAIRDERERMTRRDSFSCLFVRSLQDTETKNVCEPPIKGKHCFDERRRRIFHLIRISIPCRSSHWSSDGIEKKFVSGDTKRDRFCSFLSLSLYQASRLVNPCLFLSSLIRTETSPYKFVSFRSDSSLELILISNAHLTDLDGTRHPESGNPVYWSCSLHWTTGQPDSKYHVHYRHTHSFPRRKSRTQRDEIQSGTVRDVNVGWDTLCWCRFRSAEQSDRSIKLERVSERFCRCRWSFSFHLRIWFIWSTTIIHCSRTFALVSVSWFFHGHMPKLAMSTVSCVDCEYSLHRSSSISLSPSVRINQTSLIEATEHLLQVFYGFEASLVKVTCQIEVSEQYHIYLQTRQPSKEMCIAAIEQYTHTSIQFPMNHLADEQTMINNSSNGNGRRTSVTITGSPAQVCQARKLFDVSREENPVSVLMYVSLACSSYACRSFWLSKYRRRENPLVVCNTRG